MFTTRLMLNTTRLNVRLFSTTTRTFPTGFRAAGVRCGIKKKKDALDFAMVKSDTPCSAAAVFTTNQFKAGPVIACQQLLEKHANDIHGVVINSGCANACTGPRGIADAHTMSSIASEHGVRNSLVMSTGVIGPFLDMDKIRDGIKQTSNVIDKISVEQGWINASQAIMTTDTVPKLITRSFPIGKHTVTFGGICKGAGMIHPNMATMLSVIATDAAITPECLKAALKYAVDRSFNSMSVDGDTSTNDTLAVLANGRAPGLSKNDVISSTSSPEFLTFQTALTSAAQDLAQLLVRDGEGATKFATIQVDGAKSYRDAHTIASSIAQSALVKTALYGQDANWGRILCAVGYAGIPIQPEKVNLWFVGDDAHNLRIKDNPAERERLARENGHHIDSLHLVKDGRPHDTNEEIASALLKRKDIYIKIDLGLGKESATYWTCDFSLDYVKINADYRS